MPQFVNPLSSTDVEPIVYNTRGPEVTARNDKYIKGIGGASTVCLFYTRSIDETKLGNVCRNRVLIYKNVMALPSLASS